MNKVEIDYSIYLGKKIIENPKVEQEIKNVIMNFILILEEEEDKQLNFNY